MFSSRFSMPHDVKEKFRVIGNALSGIGVLIGMTIIVLMCIEGVEWTTRRAYAWMVLFLGITYIVNLLLLALAIFRRTRAFAGAGFFLTSYVHALALWITSLNFVYLAWGTKWVVIGLLLFGGGIVPMALWVSWLQSPWIHVGSLLMMVVFPIGTRVLGLILMSKPEEKDTASSE
jgi:hypothetical protein